MKIKQGDTITRARKGLKDDIAKQPGTVLWVSELIISCDVPNGRGGGSILQFDATTGISIYGPDYGWLVEIAGQDCPEVTNENE